MEADVEVIADADCAAAYDNPAVGSFDERTMLCAGRRLVGVQDACQGDSGGPLVTRAGDRSWRQVGVVSSGLGCGLPLFYGLYARAAGDPLREWIAAQIAEPGTPGTPAAPGGSGAKLRFKSRIRKVRRALLLRVSATRRLTNVKATLKRDRRVVARGRLALLKRSATIRLPGRGVRSGPVRVRVEGIDRQGRRVTRSGRGRLVP
jgi:hypothetical protein